MDIAWVLEEIFCFLLISGYVVYFVINGIYSYPVFTHIFCADGDTPENTLDTWLSSEGVGQNQEASSKSSGLEK